MRAFATVVFEVSGTKYLFQCFGVRILKFVYFYILGIRSNNRLFTKNSEIVLQIKSKVSSIEKGQRIASE